MRNCDQPPCHCERNEVERGNPSSRSLSQQVVMHKILSM
jgi:hypothetical protein